VPTVVLAEDQVLLREGIARILAGAGFDVLAQAGDAEDLMRKAAGHKPDLVITDIQMPPHAGADGLQAAIEIRRRLPGTGVVVLSQFLEERYVLDLVGDEAGGVGYLLKDHVGRVDEFVQAVRRVADGGSALDPDVLELMAQGKSNAGIGAALFLSAGTVEKHITSIFAKLGLPEDRAEHRRVLAVLQLLRAA
jgi:DNA-binding NarL/FixJ family response regulator